MILAIGNPRYVHTVKEWIENPHVKITLMASVVFASSFYIPYYFIPASKLQHCIMIAGASTGWMIFFKAYYGNG